MVASQVWNDVLDLLTSVVVVYPNAMTRLPQTGTRFPKPQALLSRPLHHLWAVLMLPPDFPAAVLSSFPNA